jgi:CHAT domain-containing protein
MEALVDESSRYLGDRFPIAVAGGVTDYQLRAAAGPVHDASRVLILAAPTLGSEMSRTFPPLKGADEEGRFIAAQFRRPVLLTGDQATLPAVDQHSAGVELFHFAGHGFSNAGNGGLLLSPDPGSSLEAGILDGNAMARQNWTGCRLAVLSACSAGTGESGPVNPESLVRGFLWAGVARVVASRWNVDTREGALLVEQFYKDLLAGSDASQALQYAARTIRAKEETRHPYFWAGFQNFGTR